MLLAHPQDDNLLMRIKVVDDSLQVRQPRCVAFCLADQILDQIRNHVHCREAVLT
jgi:hypothetical protein